MPNQLVRALTVIKHDGVLRIPGVTTGANNQDFSVAQDIATRLQGAGLVQVIGSAPEAASPKANLVVGGLNSGEWSLIPSISRIRVVGTGAISIDSRSRGGVVSTAVFAASYSNTPETIEFPYYGDAAVEIRATFPATLTVEVI